MMLFHKRLQHLSRRRTAGPLLAIFFLLGWSGPAAALAATTPSLGAAASYGVLSTTYTNPVPGTTINGDVGFTIAPAVVPVGAHPNYGPGAPYATAGADQGIALVDLNSQLCTSLGAGAIALDTVVIGANPPGTFPPGCYSSGGAMDITLSTTVTLSGVGTYIFRPGGAFTTGANSVVTLVGASACDVFWTPTATTLGADSVMRGTIIDDSGVTLGSNVGWLGRALAFASTVTTAVDDVVTAPACAPALATLRVVKQVVNKVSGTATSSDFALHVKLASVDVLGSPAAGTTTPGTLYMLAAGSYVVSEVANPLYTQSLSGDCDASGVVLLGSGESKTCTLTNEEIVPLPPPPLPLPVFPSNGPIAGTLFSTGSSSIVTLPPAVIVLEVLLPPTLVVDTPILVTMSPVVLAAPPAIVASVDLVPVSSPLLPNAGFAPTASDFPMTSVVFAGVLLLWLLRSTVSADSDQRVAETFKF